MFVILIFGFMFLIHNLYGSFLYNVSKFPDDFLYVMTSAFDGIDYFELDTFHPNMSIIVNINYTKFIYFSIFIQLLLLNYITFIFIFIIFLILSLFSLISYFI